MYVFIACFAPVYVCMWLAIGTVALLTATAIMLAIYGWIWIVFKAFYGKDL